MGDDRHTSASDELLDQARDGAMSGPGEFTLEGPDYDDVLGIHDNDSPQAGGEGMSAEDIAESLSEMGALETPDVGHQTPESSAEAPDNGQRTSSVQTPDTGQQTTDTEDPTSGMGYRMSDTSVGEPGPIAGEPEVGEVELDPWTTATSEWETYQADRDAKREARNRFDLPVPNVRTLIGIAVLGFFALPIVMNVFSGTEHISSVGVGDCFTAGNAFEIENVPVVDCSEEHDSELFATVDAYGLGSPYPGEDFLFEWAFEECVAEFEGYVGEPYADSPYYLETLIPLEDGWEQGDHTVMCTVVVVDSDLNTVMTTGSRRGIAGSDNA